MTPDQLATLRLIADMRQARLTLRGLDTPNQKIRARLIQKDDVYKALTVLLQAAEKMVSAPDESVLFWHPKMEALTEAERRWDDLFNQPIA